MLLSVQNKSLSVFPYSFPSAIHVKHTVALRHSCFYFMGYKLQSKTTNTSGLRLEATGLFSLGHPDVELSFGR